LEAGGHGCITATSNLVGKQLATVFAHVANPAKAAEVEAAQARIVAVRNISNKYVQIPAIKALIANRYDDAAWTDVRPPLVKLTREQCNEIDVSMAALA
jgi:4-hydroxy-tetrahydrodipicolinate synthase